MTVSAVVANTGGSKGKYTVVLKINGVEEARKEVTLDAGASQKVSFSIAKSIAETYDVNINELAGSSVVKEAVLKTARSHATQYFGVPHGPVLYLAKGIIRGCHTVW